MNKKEEKQLKNAYRALNKIFKINDETDAYEESLCETCAEEFCSYIKKYRLKLKKYLHVIEAELDDILGIYPKKVYTLRIFNSKLTE